MHKFTFAPLQRWRKRFFPSGLTCRQQSMKKNLGFLLLAIYLILVGVIGIFGISLGQLQPLIPALAIAAGVFLLFERR